MCLYIIEVIKVMKKAFTTAELLIAMTIIGVVAILVIPGFIQDYIRKVYTAHVKKIYGLVLASVEQACNDNNVSNFKLTKYSKAGKENDFLTTYLNVQNSTAGFATTYKSISGTSKDISLSSGATVKLPGAETINMACDASFLCTFTVDVNGPDKPNVGGRDMFTFTVNPISNNIEDADAASKCPSNANGAGCLQTLIDNEWTMDY